MSQFGVGSNQEWEIDDRRWRSEEKVKKTKKWS